MNSKSNTEILNLRFRIRVIVVKTYLKLLVVLKWLVFLIEQGNGTYCSSIFYYMRHLELVNVDCSFSFSFFYN